MKLRAGDESVALEIREAEARLVVLSLEDAGGTVRCYRAALPDDAVENHTIVRPDAVAHCLRSLLAAAGVRTRQATLVLGGRTTLCRVEGIPDGKDAAAIAERADRMRRYVVFRGQELSVDHVVQEGPFGADGSGWLLNVATLREPLLRQVAVAKRCGLAVGCAEPGMVALGSVLLASGASVRPRFVLIAGADGCEVAAVREDGMVFCQRLEVGAGALSGDGAELLNALQTMNDYQQRHAHGEAPIDELLYLGPEDGFESLADRLTQMGIRSEWLDPGQFPGVRKLVGDGMSAPGARAAMAPGVAGALVQTLGAARRLRENLRPPAATASRLRWLAPWVLVPVLVTALAWAGLSTWRHLVLSRVAAAARRLEHPAPEMVEITRLQLQESRAKARCADIGLLLGSAPDPLASEFVAELPRRLNRDVWLERIDTGRDGRCMVDGMAQVDDSVDALAESLLKSPHVEAVRIRTVSNERLGELFLTQFSLEVLLTRRRERAREGDAE